MRKFGLIGRKLDHSFSAEYFSEKFKAENILDAEYSLFPLSSIDELSELIEEYPDLKGLNVTIPYKESVFPLLDQTDEAAGAIGAVNCIAINNGKTKGFNTDWFAFYTDVKPLITDPDSRALILGSGGSSRAVQYAFKNLKIDYSVVSRKNEDNYLTYDDLSNECFQQHNIIVNTTPLGMHPDIDSFPDIDYQKLRGYLAYDLVYNPTSTKFLVKCESEGARIRNGLRMLQLQAEHSWEIWQ